MTQGLWDQHFKSIIDIKLLDAYVDSYKYEPMVVLLDQWENYQEIQSR